MLRVSGASRAGKQRVGHVVRRLQRPLTRLLFDRGRLGCGKGRIVYLAARYPFSRVDRHRDQRGVSQIARANMDRNRVGLRCPRVDIVTTDLADYEIPTS